MLQFMLDTSLSDGESSHLKWLTLSSPPLILSLLLSQSSGAQTHETASKNSQLSDYLEIISTVQCSSKETGIPTTTQSARLTRRVVDRMKQLRLISQRNGILYLHEMRAYRDGYSDDTLLDILRGCKKYDTKTLLIESNFGDGIVAELLRSTFNRPNKPLTLKKQELTYVKKTGSLIPLSLHLTNTGLL